MSRLYIVTLLIYAEDIMRNAGLKEAQAGVKIARRNITNLRQVDDTTLMAKSEEELKSLLMKMKEEITPSGPITSWEIDGETMGSVRLYFLGAPKSLQMVIAAMKLKDALLLGRKVMSNLDSI